MRRMIGMIGMLGMLMVAMLTASAGFGETAPGADHGNKVLPPLYAVATDTGNSGAGDAAPVVLTKTVSAVVRHLSKVSSPPKAAGGEAFMGAEIKIAYPRLRSSAGRDAAVDAINTAIMKILLAEGGDRSPALSVGKLMDNFLADFAEALKEDPNMLGGWSRDFQAQIRHADDELLSLGISDSAFTGGAHPSSNVIYLVFSMKTGEPVRLAALVPEANRAALTRIAERLFRVAREMKPGETYSDAGFTFEKDVFALNDNFLVSKDGLSFYFNSYEIAPYSMGATELVIPWSDLKSVIDPKGPAGRFLVP